MLMRYIYYECHLRTIILGHNKHQGSYFEALNSLLMLHMFIQYTEDTDNFDTWSIFLAVYLVPRICITLAADFSFFLCNGEQYETSLAIIIQYEI